MPGMDGRILVEVEVRYLNIASVIKQVDRRFVSIEKPLTVTDLAILFREKLQKQIFITPDITVMVATNRHYCDLDTWIDALMADRGFDCAIRQIDRVVIELKNVDPNQQKW
jgi:hypothetical protein